MVNFVEDGEKTDSVTTIKFNNDNKVSILVNMWLQKSGIAKLKK